MARVLHNCKNILCLSILQLMISRILSSFDCYEELLNKQPDMLQQTKPGAILFHQIPQCINFLRYFLNCFNNFSYEIFHNHIHNTHKHTQQIHRHTYMQTHIQIYTYTQPYTQKHTYINIYTHLHKVYEHMHNTYTCTHKHKYMQTYYTHDANTNIQIHSQTWIYT